MSDYIWFIQAANSSEATRGFGRRFPEGADKSELKEQFRLKRFRAERFGELMEKSDLITDLIYRPSSPYRSLDTPFWYGGNLYFREELLDVLLQFDLGHAVKAPATIILDSSGATNTDFTAFGVSNIKPTIVPELSEPLLEGAPARMPLHTFTDTCEGVVAYPSTNGAPHIWRDPDVALTLFISDALAQAIIDAGFKKDLDLKKVRIAPEQ